MGLEPMRPGLNPGVLTRPNYGVIKCNDGQVVPQDGIFQAGFEPAPDFHPGALSWRAAFPWCGG